MFFNSLKATILSRFLNTAQLLMNEHDWVVAFREFTNIQMVQATSVIIQFHSDYNNGGQDQTDYPGGQDQCIWL